MTFLSRNLRPLGRRGRQDSIACLGAFSENRFADRKRLFSRVKKNQKKLRKLARHAPLNHAHLVQLVEAEQIRLLGDFDAAADLYDRAIESAANHRYRNDEALAGELAGRFYLERNQWPLAIEYLRDARHAYARWGAKAKVKDLEATLGALERPEPTRESHVNVVTRSVTLAGPRSSGSTQTSTATSSIVLDRIASSVPARSTTIDTVERLYDLGSVIKASQSISGEMDFTKLLDGLLKIVIENAGANKGLLILQGDKGLTIEAQLCTEQDEHARIASIPLEQSRDLPPAVVQYVAHSRECVVSGNAASRKDLVDSSYLERVQPKSILCIPILRHSDLIGILYLENNLTYDAFPPARIEVLQVLASQAAISIENAKLVKRLQDALARAEESDRLKTEFLSTTTHELRTPLNAIINLPEHILQQTSTYPVLKCAHCAAMFEDLPDLQAPEAAEERGCPQCGARSPLQRDVFLQCEVELKDICKMQEIVRYSGRSLLQIVNNILEISEHEGKRSVLVIDDFAVKKLIDKVVDLVKPSAERKEIRLSVTGVPSDLTLHADWTKLGQALHNLLDNAIKFSPNSSEVALVLEVTDEAIRFSVIDQGIDIAEEHHALIFESFRQLDEGSTRQYGGVGLGLPVTRNLVELHGGKIWLESKEGKGSSFHIEVPRRIASQEGKR